ncbi:PLD nuclease N-terminal domain-containing protein [Glycomyces paridis]|uniref:PLDc_N domain-containing protein n=1 Tax=Glycomyces paridis TaxID=2126555 RepID=A0A4S8PC44_9ACTN|nr:PLD nuclease N-terminal domain-containing protein [Glycomyces paridis]THV27281.1 PLDc_N domain-containing protein [Glycomyces paridis]
MVRAFLFLFLAHLALVIAALADCLGGEHAPRKLTRAWWVAIILLVPVAGGILWFAVGRARPRPQPGPGSTGSSGGPRSPRGPVAPDDDPDFLRDIDRRLRDDNKED